MNEETMDLLLTNRSFLYALVARAYAEEIDGDFTQIFTSSHAREEVCLVETDSSASIVSLYDELVQKLTCDDAIKKIAAEYVRVFVGPGTLRAEPWETVQLTGKRALFQSGVLEVRDAYRAAGFQPVRVREVPDDFIGMELDFMAKMSARAHEEFACGNAQWQETLRQSNEFLQNHLLRWIDKLSSAIKREYGDVFYAAFTEFTELITMRDAQVVAQLLKG